MINSLFIKMEKQIEDIQWFDVDYGIYFTSETGFLIFSQVNYVFLSSWGCLFHCYFHIVKTRPKPVGHGDVFSMAVGTIGEWLKLVPFLLGDEQLILRGAGWHFFKNKYAGRQTPENKYSGLGPWENK